MKLGLFGTGRGSADTRAAHGVFRKAVQRFEGLNPVEREALQSDAARMRATLAHLDQKSRAVGPSAFPVPVTSDLEPYVEWSGRPTFWLSAADPTGLAAPETGAEVGQGVKVFHDCPEVQICVGQRSNRHRPHLPPFGLMLDVMAFEGSFLSLAFDMPEPMVKGLNDGHILDIDVPHAADRSLGIFVRLNLQCGPNTATMLRELPRDGSGTSVSFDLAYDEMDASRLDNAWLDILFEDPAWLGVTLQDLRMVRRRRAEL